MSLCLSHFPMFSQRITTTSPNKQFASFPHFLNTNNSQKNYQKRMVRAEAAGNGGGDNLDHLQRASNKNIQQPTPLRRVTQPAPIGLWDRFPTARTVQQMMDTMERMMEDPLSYGSAWPSPAAANSSSFSRGRTPWEIKEEEQEYKMRFDMPGMTKENVKVFVEEKMLVVKAEKVEKQQSEGGEAMHGSGEWTAKSYGKYNFRIALPENIQFEKIKAEVKDGVLYISVPKASVSSKVLDINVG